MGYDIRLYHLGDFIASGIKNGECCEDMENFQPAASTYLSYNFSAMSDVWDAYSWFGKTTNEAIPELELALQRLLGKGYEPKIPEGCDGWTSIGENGWHVFCCHVNRLLELFSEYPNCVITADIDFTYNICPEILKGFANQQENNQEENNQQENKQEEKQVIYYRHWINGDMVVDNFAKAAEVFVIELTKNSPNAQAWLDLALKMSDAPK